MKHKVYLIGIGGIGVSAIARYYLSEGWEVSGSDSVDSELIHDLQKEGCDIIIGKDAKRIEKSIELVVYSEAVPSSQEELKKAKQLGIQVQKYNEALAHIANHRKLVAVTGTHGKSTTSSLVSMLLQNTDVDFLSIVGTLVREFDGKNFYKNSSSDIPEQEYFVIEACEYKEHFLTYTPTVLVITNIEYDHADYFTTEESYIDAFQKAIANVVPGGFVILNGDDTNTKLCMSGRDDIHYITVFDDHFIFQEQRIEFPTIRLGVPGEHILFDAKLAYVVGYMVGVEDTKMLQVLQEYSGVWRRMEQVGVTKNKNILMSDYGHHPTEIQVTLQALKRGYSEKKMFVVFQPHQYNRTIQLLEGFQDCFSNADQIIIPDIYESRDSDEDKKAMSSEILVGHIEHPHVYDGKGLRHTLQMIQQYDSEHPDSSIILLLGAGNVDNLRYEIEMA